MKSSQSNWYEELLKHILSKCSHQVRNIGAIRRLIQRHSIAVMVLMATIKNVAMWNISMWNLEYLRANSFTQQIDLTDCTFCAIHPLKLKNIIWNLQRVTPRAIMCCVISIKGLSMAGSSRDFNGSVDLKSRIYSEEHHYLLLWMFIFKKMSI